MSQLTKVLQVLASSEALLAQVSESESAASTKYSFSTSPPPAERADFLDGLSRDELLSDLKQLEKLALELGARRAALLEAQTSFARRRGEKVLQPDGTEAPRYGPETQIKVENAEKSIQDFLARSDLPLAAARSTVEAVRGLVEAKQAREVERDRAERKRIQDEADAKALEEKLLAEKRERELADKAHSATAKTGQTSQDPLLLERRRLAQEEQGRSARGGDAAASVLSELSLPLSLRKSLVDVFENIVKRPEKPEYRTFRLDNPHVRELVEPSDVRALLWALGFDVRFRKNDTTGEDALVYYLEEPNVETEFELWGEWFDALKTAHDTLKKGLSLPG